MKSMIRRALMRLDIGFYRPSNLVPGAVEGFDVDFLPEVDQVIDVGVAFGTGWLYDRFPGAELVLIDPVEKSDHLRALLADRPHTFHQFAAGAEPGTGTVTVDLDEPGRSSLLQRTEFTETDRQKTRQDTEIRTLDEATRGHRTSGRGIGLKIDTEGYELEVLRGAVETLAHCAFVVCEVSVRKRFENSYRFEDLVGFMASQGFTVASLLEAEADHGGIIRFVDLAFLPVDS